MYDIDWFGLIMTGFELAFKAFGTIIYSICTIGYQVIRDNPWILIVAIVFFAFKKFMNVVINR